MKKNLIITCLFTVFSFAACKDNPSKNVKNGEPVSEENNTENQQKMPVMTFDESEYDFGNITSGTKVEKIFTFTNTGKAPLVVTDVKSSCGCTVPSKPTEPIAPGEKGEIKVNYNGSGLGQITKVITITANTETGVETLKIKGLVEKKTATTNN